MGYSSIGNLYVIQAEEFKPDRKLLKAMFMAPHNEDARNHFFSDFSEEERQQWHEDYNTYLSLKRDNIDFFKFLKGALKYKRKHGLIKDSSEVAVTQNCYRPYRVPDDKEDLGHKVVTAVHPPQGPVLIATKAKAIPYHSDAGLGVSTGEATAFGRIIEQNNYSNLILQSIGAQTSRIETKLETIQEGKMLKASVEPVSLPARANTSTSKVKINPPCIQPPIQLDSTFKLKASDDLLNELKLKLDALSVTQSNKGKDPAVQAINEGQKTEEEGPETINRLKWGKLKEVLRRRVRKK